jgi:hypothetical protein
VAALPPPATGWLAGTPYLAGSGRRATLLRPPQTDLSQPRHPLLPSSSFSPKSATPSLPLLLSLQNPTQPKSNKKNMELLFLLFLLLHLQTHPIVSGQSHPIGSISQVRSRRTTPSPASRRTRVKVKLGGIQSRRDSSCWSEAVGTACWERASGPTRRESPSRGGQVRRVYPAGRGWSSVWFGWRVLLLKLKIWCFCCKQFLCIFILLLRCLSSIGWQKT